MRRFLMALAFVTLSAGFLGCATTRYDMCGQYRKCQKDFTATGQYYGGMNPDALDNAGCGAALRAAWAMRGAPPSCNPANTPPIPEQ